MYDLAVCSSPKPMRNTDHSGKLKRGLKDREGLPLWNSSYTTFACRLQQEE